jgi:hypothetical protein
MTALRRVFARLRRQEGTSLMEVLVGASLMVVVLGAALAPFEMLQRTDRTTKNQADSQDNARNTVDILVHQLRNVMGQSQLIDRASPYDLVFETVDPRFKPQTSDNDRNLMRVRYCLDTSTSPASPSNGRLWEQDLTWTSAQVPSTMPGSACPDTGFGSRRVVADAITNRINGQDRALFVYSPGSSPLASITGIKVDLFSARRPSEAPRESELGSSVFLRNQNGAPTASATVTAAGGSRQVALNGSASSDPENLPLTYRWCDLSTTSTCNDTTNAGSGQLFTYTLPGTGARNMVLEVFDAGGLESDYTFTANAP